MKKGTGEHLGCYIENLVEEGEIKKCYVTNLKLNNTDTSVSLLVNKKLMCSILTEAEKNERQKEKTAEFTLLPITTVSSQGL